jgi:hypothetical protein
MFLVKNANFFAKFFGENISKIITSVPGWANLRPVFLKITYVKGPHFEQLLPR